MKNEKMLELANKINKAQFFAVEYERERSEVKSAYAKQGYKVVKHSEFTCKFRDYESEKVEESENPRESYYDYIVADKVCVHKKSGKVAIMVFIDHNRIGGSKATHTIYKDGKPIPYSEELFVEIMRPSAINPKPTERKTKDQLCMLNVENIKKVKFGGVEYM